MNASRVDLSIPYHEIYIELNYFATFILIIYFIMDLSPYLSDGKPSINKSLTIFLNPLTSYGFGCKI